MAAEKNPAGAEAPALPRELFVAAAAAYAMLDTFRGTIPKRLAIVAFRAAAFSIEQADHLAKAEFVAALQGYILDQLGEEPKA